MDTLTDTCPAVHQNGTAHRESPDVRPAAAVLRLHFYHSSQGADEYSFLSYPPGDYVAEELCIDAAKACSISPLYCSLFGLFRERDRLWFSPNHIFQLDELASEDVFFRIRYYFPGWYSGGASRAYRHGVAKGSESPVLDDFVMSYLFSQRLVEEMTLEEHRQLTSQLLRRQPGLFDALMMHQLRHGAPPFTGVPGYHGVLVVTVGTC